MVSICILNWKCLDTLKASISRIRSIKDLECEVLVFDQGSTDGSKDFLTGAGGVRAFLSPTNVGNSISRNVMVREAKHKYVLLLDSDIVLIPGSVEKMAKFMEENQEFAFLGYNYHGFTRNMAEATCEETGVDHKDVVVWKNSIALTQYGMFKKSVLEDYPFPEFAPFDGPGWGGEDDMVGIAIRGSSYWKGGMIMGRTYYHEKGSSVRLLGENEHKMLYMNRTIHLKYFSILLDHSQRVQALRTKTLPRTILPCNKYHWGRRNNLGDVATDIMFKRCFPFLEIDRSNGRNLLMFGGSIFNHLDNANRMFDTEFKKILYFGVGLSGPQELASGKNSLAKTGAEFVWVPRGNKTAMEASKAGIQVHAPCGDVLQLCSILPPVSAPEGSPELLISDVFKQGLIKPDSENFTTIRVAEGGEDVPFEDFEGFIRKLASSGKVYSSQIHPALISAMLGRPCRFHQKDWRMDDLRFFMSFKTDMTQQDSMSLRREAQSRIEKFGDSFFSSLKIVFS